MRAFCKTIQASVIFVSATLTAQAQQLSSPLTKIERPDFSRGNGIIRNYAFGTTSADRIMDGLRRGQLTLDQAVMRTLYNGLLNQGIEMRGRTLAPSFALTTTAPSRDYRFFVNGVPFCSYQVKAHDVAGQQPAVMGTYPDIDVMHAPISSDWPSFEETLAVATDALDATGVHDVAAAAIEKSACLIINNNQLVPVWSMTVRANGRHYRLIADDVRSYELQRSFFDATGTAKVYERNPVESQLKDFTLNDLEGNGTLTSSYFTTQVYGVDRANNASNQFVFAPTDKRFDEASTFTHASEMLTWFMALGYDWQNGKKIVISVNNPHEDIVNNAQYDPGGGDVNPMITIGSGDGQLLKNLPRDADVVSHELGHHIIYRTLTSTDGESLVLHEGIADFFAFAHAGDSCLGESICPTNSPVCVVKGKCLRTADNSIRADSADLPSEAHKRGQLISGMLWDLRKNGTIPNEDLTKLVLKSLDYLLARSGYHDFILSMMIADKNVFSGTYACKITDAANARGLASYISDIDCTKELPSLTASDTSSTGNIKKSSKSSKHGVCGVISTASTDQPGNKSAHAAWLLALALLAPFLLRRRPTVSHNEA